MFLYIQVFIFPRGLRQLSAISDLYLEMAARKIYFLLLIETLALTINGKEFLGSSCGPQTRKSQSKHRLPNLFTPFLKQTFNLKNCPTCFFSGPIFRVFCSVCIPAPFPTILDDFFARSNGQAGECTNFMKHFHDSPFFLATDGS